jgi:hypothetical protein
MSKNGQSLKSPRRLPHPVLGAKMRWRPKAAFHLSPPAPVKKTGGLICNKIKQVAKIVKVIG